MKKFLLLFLTAAALFVFAQEEAVKPLFTLKTQLKNQNALFKSGEDVSFTTSVSCPDTFRLAGWTVLAYLPNIPGNFCEALKLKPNISKDPRWSSVHFQSWRFLAPGDDAKERVCTFSTKGWPEGDYRLSVNVLFRMRKAPNVKTDKYLVGKLVFSIEK